MITNCIFCKISGEKLGNKDIYNKHDSADPSGKSYGVRKTYEIFQCTNCKLFWVKDIDEKNYESFYDSDFWTTYMERRGWINGYTKERLDSDLKYANLRLPEIKKFVSGGSYLDIGCSTGAMLKVLGDNGFTTCNGVEPDSTLSKKAFEYTNCYIHPKALDGTEKHIPNDNYDLITACDVIEHLTNPLEQVKVWVNKLKVGGVIWIEAPDSGCDNCVKNPLEFDYCNPEEHIFYYNKEHIRKIFTTMSCACLYSDNQWTTDRMRLVFKRVF